MTNLIFVCIIVVLLILIVVFATLTHKYKSAYTEEHCRLINIESEYSKLIESYNIKKKNKEKADEKISDLHNGTMSADDILPKRKG